MENKTLNLRRIARIGGEEFSYYMLSIPYVIGLYRGCIKLPVLVNGSPKTGTTWMHKLITSLPGYSRAVGYNFHGQLGPFKKVAPGEVVHGHDGYSNELWDILRAKKFKVILMMRDPRDQTVSRMFHIRRDPNHRWYQKMQSLKDDEALMACIQGGPDGLPGTVAMINLTKSWLRENDKCLLVKYEDLNDKGNQELKRVLEYLNISISDSLVHSILSRNRFERLSRRPWQDPRNSGQQNQHSHFRKGIVGDWKNHFSAKHISRYKELAGDVLIRWKYEVNNDW